MTDVQYRVISTQNLLLRAGGSKRNAVVAILSPGVIVHVAGAANAAGFAPAYVAGHLDGDGKTLRTDSLDSPSQPIGVDAVLYVAEAFRATGAADEYGRTPGEIDGWLAVKWVKEIEAE